MKNETLQSDYNCMANTEGWTHRLYLAETPTQAADAK